MINCFILAQGKASKQHVHVVLDSSSADDSAVSGDEGVGVQSASHPNGKVSFGCLVFS